MQRHRINARELAHRVRHVHLPSLIRREREPAELTLRIEGVSERAPLRTPELHEHASSGNNIDRTRTEQASHLLARTLRLVRSGPQQELRNTPEPILESGFLVNSGSLEYISIDNNGGGTGALQEAPLPIEAAREMRSRAISELEGGPFTSARSPGQVALHSPAGQSEGSRGSLIEFPPLQVEAQRPTTPEAARFLRGLPFAILEEIPEEDRWCGICHEPYLHGSEPEQPVLLPCPHVFGQRCINRWLSPDNTEPVSTCPICRRSFFHIDIDNEAEPGDEAHTEWDTRGSSRTSDDDIYETNVDAQLPRTATEARSQMQNFEQRWSGYISTMTYTGHFTRQYVPRPSPNARRASEILRSFRANSSPTDQEAIILGEEMGQLFINLRTTMRLLRVLPAWNEFGPPHQSLMSFESRLLIETALQRMLVVEEAWLWAVGGQ